MQFRKKAEPRDDNSDSLSLNERNSMALRIRAIEAELASLQVQGYTAASNTTITVMRKDDPFSK